MSRSSVRSASPVVGVAALMAAVAASSALAASPPEVSRSRPNAYVYRTIDVPFGVAGVDLSTQLVWVNNAGVVTVQYQSPIEGEWFENMHTAVLRDGAWTIIDVPDAVGTGGSNVNKRGQVVLSHVSEDGVWGSAFHDQGGLTPFPDIAGYPGGIITQGVNDHGQIAAVVIDAEGVGHGFFGDGHEYVIVDYPAPEVVFTQGNMMNNAGVGVGTYLAADGYHAFKWMNGEIFSIDPPVSRGTEASATSINNSGVIAGIWLNPEGVTTGYVQNGGRFTEFVVPGSTYTLPYFINDRGQISGVYGDADGAPHGFVATPVSMIRD